MANDARGKFAQTFAAVPMDDTDEAGDCAELILKLTADGTFARLIAVAVRSMDSDAKMREMKNCLFVATLLLFAVSGCGPEGGEDIPADCVGPGEIPYDIEQDRTVEAGCYHIDGETEVSNGTLTLEPGTVFVFAEDARLAIENDGRLNAEGTEDDPIVFTADEEVRGYWRGLRYRGTFSTDNVLEHVVIEYGGADAWHAAQPANLTIDDSRVEVSDVTLRESAGFGLSLRRYDGVDLDGDNTITDNAASAWLSSPTLIAALDSSNDFTGNDDDGIAVGSGDIESDAVWPSVDVPLYPNEINIIGGTVEIEAGNEFRFQQDGHLDVDDRDGGGGRLKVLGEEDHPVEFRGAESIAGFWRGVRYRLTNSEDNQLEHVVIADGGADTWHGADEPSNLMVTDSRLKASDLTLENSEGVGIFLRNDLDLDFDCATIDNDDGYATYNTDDPPC